MRVLLTGATGYIGSAVAEKLLSAGHEVIGLARSDEAASILESHGIEARKGDLRDGESLAAAAQASEAVIHTANTNDRDAAEADRRAEEIFLSKMEGRDAPFVYTSGIWVLGNTGEHVADEETPRNPAPLVAWRAATEERLKAVPPARRVRIAIIRPAIVYGGRGGIIGDMLNTAREKGSVRYVGSGENHWPLVHVDDLAELYVLALENLASEPQLFNAATGPAMRVREVAEIVSRAAGVDGRTESWPIEEARRVLGPFADALALDQQVSGEKAKRVLGWKPEAPALEAALARDLS